MKVLINLLNKIIIIIKSKLRDKNKLKNEEWYSNRVEACNKCEYNSKYHMNTIKNDFKEKAIYIANQKKNYCMICKCAIVDKASEKLEECSDKKNKKWESIQY